MNLKRVFALVLMASLALLMLKPTCARAEMIFELWEDLYDSSIGIGTPNYYAYTDSAWAVKTDGQGNVYVAENSRRLGDYPWDSVIVKYDTDGNREVFEWIGRVFGISAGAPGEDIHVSEDGSIYGTVATEPFHNNLIYTWKLGSNGISSWEIVLDHPVDEEEGEYPDDCPVALAVDANGDVYVAGRYITRSELGYGVSKYVTVKYRGSDGEELWKRFYPLGASVGVPGAMVLDYDGNVFVTGNSGTVKYDPYGNEVGTSNYAAYLGYGCTDVDAMGNFYLGTVQEVQDWDPYTGELYWHYDLNTVKFDADFNELWNEVYGLAYDDTVTHLIVDTDGNVYVTGVADAEGERGFLTIKYDENGETVWAVDGEGCPSWTSAGMVVDPAGNAYVVRNIGEWLYDGVGVISKLDSLDGHEIWEVRYNLGNAYNVPGFFCGLVLDAENNVFVAGSKISSYVPQPNLENFDVVTIKYTQVAEWTDVSVSASEDGSFTVIIEAGVDKGEPVTGWTELSTTNIESYTVTLTDGDMVMVIEGQLQDPNQPGQIILQVDPADEIVNYFVNINPASFELQLSAGWNMVSFPYLPDDPSFSTIFSGVSYYQVLTWDGTSYVTPSTAEIGRGYWVLVLEDTVATVAGDNPVESYELDLQPGWSMIGSITSSVEAGLVFPGYYQLLTWDGTSYIFVSTIEPSKGYWALVLEPTHIIVEA